MTITAVPPGWLASAGWRLHLVRFARFHPEWGAAVIMVLAWGAFVVHGVSGHHEAPGHPHGPGLSTIALSTWALMTVAMMTPGCLPAVRHVALNSLRRRRRRAVMLFLSSYFALWVAFGAVVLVVVAVLWSGHEWELAAEAGADRVLVGALVVAAGWQMTAVKLRCLRACHRTVPLPPRGWPAEAASVRFGFQQGWTCIGSCWPLMVIMGVVGHEHLAWMVALSGLVAIERLTRLGRQMVRPSGAVLASVAMTVALI